MNDLDEPFFEGEVLVHDVFFLLYHLDFGASLLEDLFVLPLQFFVPFQQRLSQLSGQNQISESTKGKGNFSFSVE